METISVAQQMKMVKGMLDMLNEQHPIITDGIPVIKASDRGFINQKVIPFPHFTAVQSVSKTHWYIHCTDYNVWRDADFEYLIQALQEIAKEHGFQIIPAFVFISGLNSIFNQSRVNKTIFIGKHHPTIIDA